jgi:hypothetical protein
MFLPLLRHHGLGGMACRTGIVRAILQSAPRRDLLQMGES